MSPVAVFRWLVRLLPKPLRDAWGDDVVDLFSARLRDEAARGSRLAAARYWGRGVVDLLRTAVRARWHPHTEVSRVTFLTFFDSIRVDAWQALRALRHRPGFVALVVLTLGLGIGATTTVFSVFHAVLLRPLPFPSPDRLVLIFVRPLDREGSGPPPANVIMAWKEAATQFEGIDFHGGLPSEYTMTGAGGTTSVSRQWVGQALFDVLGAMPALGRSFRPDELTLERTSETVVLSHEFWQRHYGGDPSVLGQTVVLLGLPRTIVGVMPAGFRVQPTMSDVDVWLAQDFRGTGNTLPATGRLKPGVTYEQARAELQVILNGLQDGQPAERQRLVDVRDLAQSGRGSYGWSLALVFGAAAIVLLICCVNTVGLLMVRGVARGQEIATRMALGAGRRRVARGLLVESVLLALAGGLAGLLIATLGIQLFVVIAAGWYPATETFELNTSVLLFAGLVSVLVGVVTGLLPAWRAPAADLLLLVKQGSPAGARPGGRRAGQALVMVQVALALVLLTGAALLGNSLLRMLSVDMGFESDGLLVARLRVQGDRYQVTDGPINHTSSTGAAFFERLTAELIAAPGVDGVGLLSSLPTGSFTWPVPVRVVGAAADVDPVRGLYQEASEDLFETLRLPVIRGRAFTASDTTTSPWVAIVSESLAERLFDEQNPIGRIIQADLTNRVNHPALTGDRPREIVGVVADMRANLRRGTRPELYVPFRQHLSAYPRSGPWGTHLVKYIVVRAAGATGPLERAVHAAVAAADNTQRAVDVQTMNGFLAESAGFERLWTRLLGLSAAIALLLAALGIYGVAAQAVLSRRREMGIRMALGAEASRLVRMIVWQGMLPVLGGVVVGAAASYGLSRFLAGLLYEIEPTDIPTFAVAATILVAVAAMACYLPARRSANIRPVVALRQD